MRRFASTSLLLAAALVLAGCTGGSEAAAPATGAAAAAGSDAPTTAGSDAPVAGGVGAGVPFTDCGTRCAGAREGAEYRILLPDRWNGTLLIYSHGYRPATPTAPGSAAAGKSAEPVPGYSAGRSELAEALLERGFALAGSSWSANGWAVAEGVEAAKDLHDLFVSEVAKPRRVYLWGDSLGGLVTQELAETATWVDAAAPLCGVHAGVVPNMDLALDLAQGIKVLIEPAFVTHGYSTSVQASTELTRAASAVVDAAADTSGGGAAEVLALAALVDAATQTETFDGSDQASKVRASSEAIVTALGFGTVGRYDVEQRFGGNISDNTATDYAARFSAEDRAQIDAVGGKGAAQRIIKRLQGAKRVRADADAVARARASGGNPSGAIKVPTLTMHTAADPLVIVQNQSFLRERAAARGDAADLVQLFTVAPSQYPEQPGAPYGAGHCNFTPESRIGIITLLDDWVRRDAFPDPDRVRAALGPDSGYQPEFVPAPWPEPDALR